MAHAEVIVETGKRFRAPLAYKNQHGAGKGSNDFTFRECSSGMNKLIFIEFSSSYYYLLHTTNIYPLYLPSEKWNSEWEKAVHFIEAWELVRCFNILSGWFISTTLCKSLPFHILVSLPIRKDCNIFSFHKDAVCIHLYVQNIFTGRAAIIFA